MAQFTTISRNFAFLRLLYGTTDALVEKLQGIVNSNQISRYATADAIPDETIIGVIERMLTLPPGWVLRDNRAFTQLDATDHALVTSVLACNPSAKRSLQALLTSLREET